MKPIKLINLHRAESDEGEVSYDVNKGRGVLYEICVCVVHFKKRNLSSLRGYYED
jgi:hypothetical protein